MADFQFNDYSVEVKNVIAELAEIAVEECCGELEARVKRNTAVGKVAGGQLKSSWTHNVLKDTDKIVGTVGSPLERALWLEFGTGEYAIPESGKSGRKGGWYIPVGSGKGQISEAVAKAYGFTIINGKNGQKYVFTRGMKPQRPFWKAYTALKNKLIKHMRDIFKEGLS